MRDIIASMDGISEALEASGHVGMAHQMDVCSNTLEKLALSEMTTPDNRGPEIISRITEVAATLRQILADFRANLLKWDISEDRVVNGIFVKKSKDPAFKKDYDSMLSEFSGIKKFLSSTVYPKLLSVLKEIGESTPEVAGPKRPQMPSKVTDIR